MGVTAELDRTYGIRSKLTKEELGAHMTRVTTYTCDNEVIAIHEAAGASKEASEEDIRGDLPGLLSARGAVLHRQAGHGDYQQTRTVDCRMER